MTKTKNNGPEQRELEALLDVDDVAALCKTSARTVYRLVERGVIAAPIKVGKLNRWRQHDVLKNIEQLASEKTV